MDVDDALKLLGRWSRWQMFFYVVLSIVNTFPASWHMLATVFIGKYDQIYIFYQYIFKIESYVQTKISLQLLDIFLS